MHSSKKGDSNLIAKGLSKGMGGILAPHGKLMVTIIWSTRTHICALQQREHRLELSCRCRVLSDSLTKQEFHQRGHQPRFFHQDVLWFRLLCPMARNASSKVLSQ